MRWMPAPPTFVPDASASASRRTRQRLPRGAARPGQDHRPAAARRVPVPRSERRRVLRREGEGPARAAAELLLRALARQQVGSPDPRRRRHRLALPAERVRGAARGAAPDRAAPAVLERPRQPRPAADGLRQAHRRRGAQAEGHRADGRPNGPLLRPVSERAGAPRNPSASCPTCSSCATAPRTARSASPTRPTCSAAPASPPAACATSWGRAWDPAPRSAAATPTGAPSPRPRRFSTARPWRPSTACSTPWPTPPTGETSSGPPRGARSSRRSRPCSRRSRACGRPPRR